MDPNPALQAFLHNHYQGAHGLRDLLHKTQSFTDQVPRKLRAMEAVYLKHNASRYTAEEIQRLQYYREAFCYKELLCDWTVEQIWAVVHTGGGDQSLLAILQNIFDDHQTAETDTIVLSFLVENFLLQGTAFVDFFMLYLAAFFRVEETKFISWKKLESALQEVNDAIFRDKARQVEQFFAARVFAETTERGGLSIRNWGNVLRELRHATIHRDQDYPDFTAGGLLVQRKTRDWPEPLWRIECARFCEDVRGDMFLMVTKMAAALYSLEWKPGEYRPNMWL